MIALKNKRSQVGTTLNWIVAFIVLFFIMLAFIFFSSMMAAKNKTLASFLSSSNSVAELDNEYTKTQMTNDFLTFLNTPIDSSGKETVYDLLVKADLKDEKSEERKKLFNNLATKFVDSHFPSSSSSSSIILSYPAKKEQISGYALYNVDLAATPDTQVIFRYSQSITVPVSADKEINLHVSFE